MECDNRITLALSRVGDLEKLRAIHEAGCELHPQCCDTAALNGNFQCLKYCYEHGGLITHRALMYAAQYDYIACVDYILDHTPRIEGHESASLIAAAYGSFRSLLAIYIRGLPYCAKCFSTHPDFWKIRRVKNAAIIMSRKWRARKQSAAVSKIEKAWLEYSYRPGNAGFKAAHQRYLNALRS